MNLNEIKHSKRKNIDYQITPKFICTYSVTKSSVLKPLYSFMEARSGQNYLINFLPGIFNFMSFVFNSTVERINFMTCISNFLIRPINFMLHAFNYMACGINFMLHIQAWGINFMPDILYSYLAAAVRHLILSVLPCQINQISGKQLTKQLFYYSRPEC